MTVWETPATRPFGDRDRAGQILLGEDRGHLLLEVVAVHPQPQRTEGRGLHQPHVPHLVGLQALEELRLGQAHADLALQGLAPPAHVHPALDARVPDRCRRPAPGWPPADP